MSSTADIESTSLTHRVVLLGLAELSGQGETPAHAAAVVTTCNEALDVVQGDVLGRLAEADAARALKELEVTDLVAASHDSSSPTGKGRPRYSLAVDRDPLVDALGDDDRVAPVLGRHEGDRYSVPGSG